MGGIAWLAGVVVVSLSVTAASASDRGWGPLITKLDADGIPRATARRVLLDRRVPAFNGLDFSLEPRESASPYRRLLGQSSVDRARACRRRYDGPMTRAEREYGVEASLIAAILHVETQCGGYTGNHRVLYRLARLAMANEPANVARNVRRHLASDGTRPRDEIDRLTRTRAQYLEDLFYPEVRAVFHIGTKLKIDPLNIYGSGSGAFGIPQFLPTNYLAYGIDGNANGRVSLYEPPDAVASCAKFLRAHGWRSDLSPAGRRKVIWHYNRSEPYIDTVLALADRIGR